MIPPPRPSLAVRLGQAFRRYFVAGLATLIPVVLTIGILVWLFNTADRMLGRYFGFPIPGLGIVATVLLVLTVGFFSNLFGRVVVLAVEGWFGRLPLIRQIYPAIKQLTQFLFADQHGEKKLHRVVLVQYPRPGIYSVGFVTNEIAVTATTSPLTLLVVMIPQPPSPLTGPIILVSEDEVIPVDLPIEEAMKWVVSGGIVARPLAPPKASTA